ncbi:unnamed protein product, partial [Prorocentrum cordatum]
RSSPASSVALSMREQALAAAGTRVGHSAHSDAFDEFLGEEGSAPTTIEDMEVRALQFLDLTLEAKCAKSDATILVAAVRGAYPWCAGSQSMPRVNRGLRGYTKRGLPVPRVATTFFAYIRPGALRKLRAQQLLAPSRK